VCKNPEFGRLHIQAQRQVIATVCTELLYGFSRHGASEHGSVIVEHGRTSKDLEKLISSMADAMNYRARFHTDDHILTEEETSKTYTGLMHVWLAKELRPDQQSKAPSKKSSIFAAWVRKTFGSKALLCALLMFGPSLMPSGAPKHAWRFASAQERATKCLEEVVTWLARFADALVKHRDTDAMREARQRSGTQRGQSGLSQEQRDQRTRRDNAFHRLRQALQLQAEVEAYWGYNYRRFSNPRRRSWMHRWEQELLTVLQNGDLRRDFDAARTAHGGRVQAPPFRMDG
jgi:hypothetical protein